MKEVNKVEVKIEAVRDGSDVDISEMATVFVTLSDYPGFEVKKGIQVELTPTQEDAIKTHIKNIVLPQAEASA